jgi:SAM-dependent methyltransferase
VCGAGSLTLVKPADLSSMRPEDFAISDASYGRTAAIFRCGRCGFLECPEMGDVVPFYAALEDTAYLDSRPARLAQARRLLHSVERLTSGELRGRRLLDVGAGSGPLVEVAAEAGLHAEGVEPSRSLHAAARSRGLTVHHGVLPHPDIHGPFDLVTLIDVVEHTTDPLSLLQAVAAMTARDGMAVIVTPDVSSLAARLLGWRWWHFRVAHVGYFSVDTLTRLCARAGLRITAWTRPSWVLPVAYLADRVERYIPLRLPRASWMESAAVPFNLRDSILACAVPAPPVEGD